MHCFFTLNIDLNHISANCVLIFEDSSRGDGFLCAREIKSDGNDEALILMGVRNGRLNDALSMIKLSKHNIYLFMHMCMLPY